MRQRRLAGAILPAVPTGVEITALRARNIIVKALLNAGYEAEIIKKPKLERGRDKMHSKIYDPGNYRGECKCGLDDLKNFLIEGGFEFNEDVSSSGLYRLVELESLTHIDAWETVEGYTVFEVT